MRKLVYYQATERDDSWASSSDDSGPVVVARRRSGSRGCHRSGPCSGGGGGGGGVGCFGGRYKTANGRGWGGRRGGRMGAMGSLKHSTPTRLSVIKSDLHFGEAFDAAMKSDAATKGRSMSAIIAWWSIAK